MPFRPSLIASLALTLFIGLPAAVAQDAKASRFYEDALRRYEAKDLDGAAVQLRNALQADRRFLPAHLLLGKVSLQNSVHTQAEAAFAEALRLGASRSEVAVPLAKALVEQGKHALMLDDPRLQVAGLPAPVQAELLLVRAGAYSDLNDERSANAAIQQSRQLNPRAAASWAAEVPLRIRAGRHAEALAAAAEAVRLEPNSPDAQYQRGAALHVSNQLNEAISAYTAAIKLDPQHVDALLARAGVYFDRGQVELTMADIAQLRKVAPQDPRADFLAGMVADQKGDRTGSLAAMRRVAELIAPVSIESLRFRPQLLMLGGLAHNAIGERQKAKPYLEYVVRQQPRNPAAKLLAQILFEEGQVENGIQLLETYLKAVPVDTQAITLLASGHSAMGRQTKAIQLMNAALSQREDPELRAVLGQSLLRAGRMGTAQTELEEAWAKSRNAPSSGLPLAMLYLRSAQFAKAAGVAKVMVGQQPNNAGFHHLLGMAQAGLNDRKAARASFERALQLDRHLVEPQLSLARLDVREGQPAAAQRLLEAAQKANEKAVEPMLELASLHLGQGRPAEAERWLERATVVAEPRELRPHFAMLDLQMTLRNTEKVDAAAKLLLGRAADNPAVLVAYARAQLLLGKAAQARPTLVDAGRLLGHDLEAMAEVAGLQIDAGDLSGAVYTLTKVLTEQPQHPRGLLLMASAEMQRNELNQAAARVAQLEKLRPRLASTHLLAAELAMLRRQPEAALQALRRAHEVQASTATAMRLHLHLAQFDAGPAARQVAEAWLKRQPRDATVWRALAEHLGARQQWADARKAYEQLLALVPNDARAGNNFALVLWQLGDRSKALAMAESALKAAPGEARVIDTLAWLLHLNGQSDRALGMLRDARLRAPDNAEIRYHLAAVLAKLGRSGEARQELQAVLAEPAGLESVNDAQRLAATLK